MLRHLISPSYPPSSSVSTKITRKKEKKKLRTDLAAKMLKIYIFLSASLYAFLLELICMLVNAFLSMN